MVLAYQAGAKPKLSSNGQVAFGTGFGFVTGYANVICLTRYSAFGTMMTGNLLQIAKSYCESGWTVQECCRLPFPVFFGLVICARNLGLLIHHLLAKVRPGSVAIILGPMQIASMFAAEIAQYSLAKPVMPERWQVWIVAFGFGVQSQVSWPAMGIPTMMATGHMSNIFNTLMEVGLREKSLAELKKMRIPFAVTMAIFLGAIVGASANWRLKGRKRAFLLTPIAVLQAILLVLVERKATLAKSELIGAYHNEQEGDWSIVD